MLWCCIKADCNFSKMLFLFKSEESPRRLPSLKPFKEKSLEIALKLLKTKGPRPGFFNERLKEYMFKTGRSRATG